MARRNRIRPAHREALFKVAVFDATHKPFAIIPVFARRLYNRAVDRWSDAIRHQATRRRRPGPSVHDWD
jgi:hypothetical protein